MSLKKYCLCFVFGLLAPPMAFAQFPDAVWIKGGINPSGYTAFPPNIYFSRDGREVILNEGSRLKHYDVATDNVVKIREFGFSFIAFSPDSQRIAVYESYAGVRILDASTLNLINSFATGNSAAFALSADFELIVTYTGPNLKLWKMSTGKLLRTFAVSGVTAYSAFFSPDGQFILSEGSDTTLRLWAVDTGNLLWTLKTSVRWLYPSFSPDGRYIAVMSLGEKRIKLLESLTGVLVRDFANSPEYLDDISFSSNGSRLLTFIRYIDNPFGDKGGRFSVWEIASGNLIRGVDGYALGEHFSFAGISPEGDKVVTLEYYDNRSIKLWDISTGSLTKALTPHPPGVNAVGFSGDGKYLASTSSSDIAEPIKLWEVATGRLVRTYSTASNYYDVFLFSRGGRFLVARNSQGITLWDVANGAYLKTIKPPLGEAGYLLSFSPDEQYLAADVNGTIKLWEIATSNMTRGFAGHLHGILAISFSADGNRIISFGGDHQIKTWEVANGNLRSAVSVQADQTKEAAFSADHKYLTIAGDQLKLYETATGNFIRQFAAQTVRRISFSADGRHLIGALPDTTIRIWKVETGEEVYAYQNKYRADLYSLAISPDSKHLASGMSEGSVILWHVRGITTSVSAREEMLPQDFELQQNYPNPFNPSTTISFSLPRAGFVTLKIYNTLGEEVAALVNEPRAAGEYRVQWQPRGLPSGVYVYRLQAGEYSLAKKLLIVQ